MSDSILQTLLIKKAELDRFRPLPPELVKNLDDWFKVELTYTSNAIEGNTLSRSETALVIEKGITIGGKTLNEHLEAVNHADAVDFIKELVGRKRSELTVRNILDIHEIILQRIDSANAGRLRNIAVRIAGSTVILPNYVKVPILMDRFIEWLQIVQDHPAKIAADAHFKLVTIHPFIDGNGRTARLLMNLLLLQEGYHPAIIRKEDRLTYIDSIEKAALQDDFDDYYRVIFEAVDCSLDIYLNAVSQSNV
jgi:Fic family protein